MDRKEALIKLQIAREQREKDYNFEEICRSSSSKSTMTINPSQYRQTFYSHEINLSKQATNYAICIHNNSQVESLHNESNRNQLDHDTSHQSTNISTYITTNQDDKIQTKNVNPTKRKLRICLIFIVSILLSTVLILTIVLLRRQKNVNDIKSSSCYLDRKLLVQCKSGTLEIPTCAEEAFQQVVGRLLENTINHPHPRYPCNVQYFSLTTVAVAMANSATMDITLDDLIQYWTLGMLYFSLGGPDWQILDHHDWLKDITLSCDNQSTNESPNKPWYGISCSDAGVVDAIHLDNTVSVVGSIPTEIAWLSSLRILNFIGLDITGTIPSEIGTMKNLTALGLGNTRVTGTIPSEIGSCPNLRELYLDGSGMTLSGSIPSEIGKLAQLGM
jgi:Leucine-rich repeat (LRR) protein